MQLSISLNSKTIIDFENDPTCWHQSITKADEFYTLPSRLGLNSVEIKTTYADAGEFDAILSRFCSQGLQVTFHKEIYLPGHSRSFLAEYRRFIITCAKHGSYRPLVVVHGTEGKNLYAIEHRQATVESINILSEEFPQLRFAIEVNRRRRTEHQACQSYDDAMAILRRCHSKSVGVCWDLGHCHFNSLYWGQPFIPPREFLERVLNVHVHDVVKEETHHFLHPGGVPMAEALKALRGVKYNGPLTIEVSPERTRVGSNFIPRLGEMVRGIRELIKSPAYSAAV